ncbi:MAG: deoxyguanosinetriphosphate triphosphohydrolase, partial [Chlamydiota bacterium]|nr:deoxyguanosinetriphosphate triphosphohydrolase [Chlamydiota bacterium]
SLSKKVLHLREFLFEKLYNHPQVEQMNQKAQRVIDDLFLFYEKDPHVLKDSTKAKLRKSTLKTVICDYIAGMTDRFALKEHQRLFGFEDKL